MSKAKYKKQNKKKINSKTKVVVGVYFSRKKNKKEQTKARLYNAYHKLLSEKWMVERSRFHTS